MILLLVFVTIPVSEIHSARATKLLSHEPISIIGNSDFTLANGIIQGNGSISDPYIIANWTISSSDTDGIHVEQTNVSFVIRNVYVQGQALSNGIFFLNVANGVVDNATITNSYEGITISLSNATVENSRIFANADDGIKVLDAENIRVFNNSITQEKNAAIYSESCVRCGLNITQNRILSNRSGVFLRSMNNSFIFKNDISLNTNDGIGIYESTYNDVVLNNITSNGAGVTLGSSTDNLVHHNNFVGNSLQAFDNRTGQNMWDVGYASGGNFWRDYTGVDHCSGPAQNTCSKPDGIGDTPYIFTSARDNYPLVQPFTESVVHDVAVSSILPAATTVNQTTTLTITVGVANEGVTEENFTLTLYYDHTAIGSQTIDELAPSTSKMITFGWNTTGVPVGSYLLRAVESTVWGEIDVADNTMVAGPILIRAPASAVSPPTPPSQTPQSSDIFLETILVGLLLLVLVVALRRKRTH